MKVGQLPGVKWTWGSWEETPREVKLAVGALVLVGLVFLAVGRKRVEKGKVEKKVVGFCGRVRAIVGDQQWQGMKNSLWFSDVYIGASEPLVGIRRGMVTEAGERGHWGRQQCFLLAWEYKELDGQSKVMCFYLEDGTRVEEARMNQWYVHRDCEVSGNGPNGGDLGWFNSSELREKGEARGCTEEDVVWFETLVKNGWVEK